MRKGIVKISDQIYKQDWKLISVIFRDFRPSHIEFRYWENDIWYFYGTSDLFDEISEGEIPPHYEVIFTRNEDGNHTYKFQRA